MIDISDVGKLNVLYSEAVAADKDLFAEMRTNVKLRNGNHFNKSASRMIDEFRSKGVISKDDKIRITKNSIHRITNEYINATMTRKPNAVAAPFNDGELEDIKNAEMANSVLAWIRETNNWDTEKGEYVHDQNVIGEAYAVVSFDDQYGKVVHTEATIDENGIVVSSEEYKEGRIKIDKRFGFDAKRDPNCRGGFQHCRFVIFDKLVDKEEAANIVKQYAPDKVSALQDFIGGNGVITVFDSANGSFSSENSKVLFREMFVRPCHEYPNGKYVLFNELFIVHSMDLPLGIFPVFQLGFDTITTTPRCSSIIRVARPYQIEINRAASKIVEHQVTLGDDKVFLPNNGKVTNQSTMSGQRVYSVPTAPVVMQGRTGEQFISYIDSELVKLYQACGVDYLLADKQQQSADPYALLYRSITQKAVFTPYLEKYEAFEKEVFKCALALARGYLTDFNMIKVVGKKEAVNIQAFKAMATDAYDIKIEATSSDTETRFGKILTTIQTLQYAGNNMEPEQIGQLIKQLPYGNKSEIFNPLTVNYDTAVNIVLGLDRGEMPEVPQYSNIDYILKALANRTVQSDFRYLPPNVVNNYWTLIKQLENIKSQQMLQAQQAQQGMIPMSGFLVTCNASMEGPDGRVQRVKIPADALAWLVEKAKAQGLQVQQMLALPDQMQGEIASINQQPMPQADGFNTSVPQAQGEQYVGY